MGTSRSAEEKTWTAGASIFSGHPDPAWPVPAAMGEGLAKRWEGLSEWFGERPEPPPLGYRGCHLAAPDGRDFAVFRELVRLGAEARRDAEREFERAVLASAPPGTLPPH
ncbi:MAG: hypothetical protein M3024_14975 [Candidatus Dormibacteraeota bacterium]|nr:hypothetical protein [Candidatus Dormibacteraeota bacterium]